MTVESNSPDVPAFPSRDELLRRAEEWESRLLGGPVTFFPIRHHSPGCALHLSNWIEEHRPESIIIEGPRAHDRWIPFLQSEACVGPVAILSTYRESNSPSALRHSAFFPLCDYSPEWIGIRAAAKHGINVRFADLDFADKVRFQRQWIEKIAAAQEEDEPDQGETDQEESQKSLLGVLLADESNLVYSEFIQELIRRLGCRNFDELWDHLFESRARSMSTGDFVGLMATHCDLARISHTKESLERDATFAREAVMIDEIRSEQKKLREPRRRGALLVVTGGFHTVALHEAVKQEGNPHRVELEPLVPDLKGSWLIRYSYDQLDALSGYQSGMPNPGFYDAIWRTDQAGEDRREAVARLISMIARRTRGKPIPHEASVTDTIAAVQMLDRLAELRDHAAPTRHDLLDAVAGCMRKESSVGNDLLASIVREVLAGDRVGEIPPDAGQPPILDDFQRKAKQFRLPIASMDSKSLQLEIYRRPEHRPMSFLFHQLQTLGVTYATFVDGPDFISGYRLGKVSEEWSVTWSPGTDARLAECAALGDTIAVAAAAQILEIIDTFEEEGNSRSAEAAVDLLIRTCRCGLHDYAAKIIAVVEEYLAEDGSFASVSTGLSRLSLLFSARETLEASKLTGISKLIHQAYNRSVFLVESLATVPDDQLDASLDGLLSIRELLTENAIDAPESPGPAVALSESRFYDALLRLIHQKGVPPRSEISGAAAGLLYGIGRIDAKAVCAVVGNYLDASVEDVGDACGVVRGLMMTARESFWQMDGLLRRIDELFNAWEDERFNSALPHMRLAFSQLAPKEVDSVAERVANLHDVSDLGQLIHPEIAEEDLQLALRCSEYMQRSLLEDGLQ